MPTNYDAKRRIGAIIRSGGAILAFIQYGDEFYLTTPILDVDVTTMATTAVTRTLTVPTGVKVKAIVNALVKNGTASVMALYLSSLDTVDLAASVTVAPLASAGGSVSATIQVPSQQSVWTNTSAQIRSRVTCDASNPCGAADLLKIATIGWVDTREE